MQGAGLPDHREQFGIQPENRTANRVDEHLKMLIHTVQFNNLFLVKIVFL